MKSSPRVAKYKAPAIADVAIANITGTTTPSDSPLTEAAAEHVMWLCDRNHKS